MLPRAFPGGFMMKPFVFFLSLLFFALPAKAEEYALDDMALGDVTAKGIGLPEIDLEDNVLNFALSGLTKDGIGIDIVGNTEILQQALPDVQNVGAVVLKDQAQQNLQALVNVNAVNSLVQVLLNLNISIDSTVGSIAQGNLVPIIPHP
jgi:hypothetical protein